MNKIKLVVAGLAVMALSLLATPLAGASMKDDIKTGTSTTVTTTVPNAIAVISNIIIFFVGVVAVIMLIVGGFKYTTSGGDQSSVTAAKNTILYAIVGIIVALMSYAIVNFVITQFK
ncbi:hypothetical protein JNJ66_06985 [Candidatus Saccharibacteria bacterium]|nr:hypothetical protein [Candidatus Saccharibacteria bacterium]